MRTRLKPGVADAVRRLALREGRSDQEMVERLLSIGLQSFGAGTPRTDTPPDRPTLDTQMTLPLPAGMYAAIKTLARDQGRSGKAMTRIIIDAGLAAMGGPARAGDEGQAKTA